MDVRELATRHCRALSLGLRLEDRTLALRYVLALYALHLLGLLAVVRFTHQLFWLALIPILLIQPLGISLRTRRPYALAESLAPLFIAYLVLGLRLLIALVARFQGLTSGSLTVPEPWGGMLNLNIAAGLCGVWVLMAQAGPTTQTFGRRVHWTRVVGLALGVSTLAWALVSYLAVRTHGVTGSDPYAYAQMAVDIARNGTPLHSFPLAPRVAGWGLPAWPAVPVGYRPPHPSTGVAATVWPPGYSVALAIGYGIGGEAALYLLTPLLGVLALVILWWLSLEVLRTWQDGWRFLAAGIALFMLASSYEQVDRLSVPMADIPAQLFTMLTVYFALRVTRGRTLAFAALTGVGLGIAFAMRYTQVLVVFSVLSVWAVFFYHQRPRSYRTVSLAVLCFGIAAWLMAAPVLGYHKLAFGSPLRVGGTAELALFGWQHVPRTLGTTLKSFLTPKEFLYLVPFMVWGLIRLWRSSRQGAIALVVWLMVIVAFHLPYPALRVRDLLSVFPVLAIWTGAGIADALSQARRVRRSAWRMAVQVAVLALVIALFWARSQVILWLPVHAQDFNTFGYLRAEQRAAFDTLARQTSPQGIVAASLNGGAVTLYAKRDIARPAYWSAGEWLDFVAQAFEDGRRVYLLVDGVEMEAPLEAAGSHYSLELVSSLAMPYFYAGGSSESRDVLLYEVVSTGR